jgi:hypothetical protein
MVVANHAAVAPLAGKDAALLTGAAHVEPEAVGGAALVAVDLETALVRVVGEDLLVGDVGEEDLVVLDGDGALGKGETAEDALDLCIFGDDVGGAVAVVVGGGERGDAGEDGEGQQ